MKKYLISIAIVLLFAIGAKADTGRLGADSYSFNPTREVTKTASYTVTTSDSLINCTTSAANLTFTLPSLSDARAAGGMALKLLKTDSNAYSCIFSPATGDTVGGESARYVINQNDYVVITAGPGSDWTVDYESPFTKEDHEAGTVTFPGISATLFASDITLTGTTPSLTVGDAGAEDTTIVFDGNAQDYYIGLDDTDDDLDIGLGSTPGTTSALSIDENQVITVWQDPIFAGTTPLVTIGDAGAEDTVLVFDGNAQDFYMGLDDTDDDLDIGLGTAPGTTPALSIDENQVITVWQDPIFAGATPAVTVGDAGEEDAQVNFDGNAQDFHIGLDDSADDLVIGVGTALGTTPAIAIDENAATRIGNRLSEIVTTTNVLTAAECGTTYYLNAAGGFTTTLPAISTVSAGCEFMFWVDTSPTTAYIIITGNSLENLMTAGVNELEVDTTEDGPYLTAADTFTFVANVAVIGDFLECHSNGAEWFCRGQTNADGGATVVQAD